MRILFLTHAYPRFLEDAAGSFLHRLAVALHACGAEVQVLCPSGEGLPAEEHLDGIGIHRFRYAPKRFERLAYSGTMAEQVLGSVSGKGALAGMLANGTLAVRRRVEAFDPDVVHAHWWFPSGLLALGGVGDIPLLTTLHGSDVRLARRVGLVHPLFRRVMRRSGVVTAVSSWLAGEARAMSPETAIQVAPMPADVHRFTPHEGERIPGRFLLVGRLNAQKGVADLIEALAWLPAHFTADIVGEGEDRAALEALVKRHQLGGRVHFLGQVPRDALPHLFRQSQASVLPARSEGLGLVAVESQLCGTPVIAYRSGGLPDVVDPTWGGTLVQPGDLQGLAEAMRRVASDPSQVRTSGAAARATMLDRFAPTKVAAGYLARYRGLIHDAD